MSDDRPDPTRTDNAGGGIGPLSPRTRKVIGGLVAVNQILTVWIPAILAAVVLVIGLATSSVVYIVVAVVLGIFAAYAWVRNIGVRNASDGK